MSPNIESSVLSCAGRAAASPGPLQPCARNGAAAFRDSSDWRIKRAGGARQRAQGNNNHSLRVG
eukprot:4357142-Alexandrium_andersonii.AAC.1